MDRDLLDISSEVRSAINDGLPVVALESTIIAHGMDYPKNLDLAREVEAIIRDRKAIPATIAVIQGRLKVGLTAAEIDRIASEKDFIKASVRDLPGLIALSRNGATTVSATMRIAAMAGIAVFATGGIGGVHRGADQSFDISADLPEFAVSRVAVVSAGAKAILDLPATLEYLETLGVPVIGFGADEFPEFYSRGGDLKIHWRADSIAELSRMVRARFALGAGGVLVANPIPAAAAIPHAEIEQHIAASIEDARSSGIKGKDLTPFLLRRLVERTGGQSQRANMALVRNNAELAAELAQSLIQ